MSIVILEKEVRNLSFKDYIKLVAKLVVLFTFILWTAAGAVYLSYKFLKGDYNIPESIGKIISFAQKDKRINGVILGTDKSGLRTDFIMFVSYDPKNNRINMISIPRDTRVAYSVDKKINSLYLKGKEELVMKSIGEILGVPVEYYAVVHLEGFRKIIDKIGGIPMYVPTNMKYYDPYQNLNINISKGYQVLDGAKAEGFVRFRSGYPTGDLGRISAQQEFIKAAIEQFLKPQNIPRIPTIINIISEHVKTNMPTSKALTYVDDVVKIKKENIIIEKLPGEPRYIGGVSYFIYDPQETKQLVERMFYNEVDEKAAIERNKKYKVEVYNGTNIPGLATKTAESLKQKGFNVVRVANNNYTVKETKIIERHRRAEGSYVKDVIKVGKVSAEYDGFSDVDITVIVGQDLNI